MKLSSIIVACCITAIVLVSCHLPPTPEEIAQDAWRQENAKRDITCSGKDDCDIKWSRALEWVQTYSRYNIRIASNRLIETYGPSARTYEAAFSITKKAEGKGHYTIVFKVRCVEGYCTFPVHDYKSSFVSAVMDGEKPIRSQ